MAIGVAQMFFSCLMHRLMVGVVFLGMLAAARRRGAAPSRHILRAYEMENFQPKCSRSKSRQARAIVTSYVLPTLEQFRKSHGVTFARNCIFDPSLDMYAEQELKGKEQTHANWYCPYSKKYFLDEGYIDLHLTRHWGDKIPSNATVCLGDYCDVLSCPPANKEARYRLQCRPKDRDLRHFKCINIFQKCFVSSRGISGVHKIDSALTKLFCSRDICDYDKHGGFDVSKPGWFGAKGHKRWLLYILGLISLSGVVSLAVCFYYEHTGKTINSDLRVIRKRVVKKID